jgi:hypothetical protein
MSLDQLKEKVVELTPRERRQLMAFMVALETEQDQQFRAELARKIDDRNPANWVELDELQKRLSDQ